LRFLALRYFNEVARLGSIRKAADRLHVAPSAVSRQIALLEAELGTELFKRFKTGVRLMPAGEVLARQSHRIFRDLERARSGIDDLMGLRRGTISLWVIEGFVTGLLPGILSEFNQRYPNISFRVYTDSTDRIVEALLEDEADIGITFNAVSRPEIEVVAEFKEGISCLVAPSHRYAGRESLSLAELCTEQLALPVQSFGLRQVFDRVIASRGYDPRVLVTTNSLELTKTLAATGNAIAFMPALTVVRELEAGSLIAIPISDREFKTSRASVSIHRDRPLSHAAADFLKALVAQIQSLADASARHR
jgi:DNA-binding transcriptional LysR family regulator